MKKSYARLWWFKTTFKHCQPFYYYLFNFSGTQFRPGTAVIAFQPQQNAVSATTYVMAPPTAAATPVVTSVYPNPTSTYHPYPPLPQSVAAAAAPAQVYDANTKTSYYAQPPVSVSKWVIFSLNRLWILVMRMNFCVFVLLFGSNRYHIRLLSSKKVEKYFYKVRYAAKWWPYLDNVYLYITK